jgi:hypothetical protein
MRKYSEIRPAIERVLEQTEKENNRYREGIASNYLSNFDELVDCALRDGTTEIRIAVKSAHCGIIQRELHDHGYTTCTVGNLYSGLSNIYVNLKTEYREIEDD